MCLSNHRQLENGSFQALAADIRSMSSLAYQDLPPDTLERLPSNTLLITQGSSLNYTEINHAP